METDDADIYDEDLVCRRCGAEGLHWEVVGWDARGVEKWRLCDADGDLHQCSAAASADEFDDVSR